jgi:hypothetical protein
MVAIRGVVKSYPIFAGAYNLFVRHGAIARAVQHGSDNISVGSLR